MKSILLGVLLAVLLSTVSILYLTTESNDLSALRIQNALYFDQDLASTIVNSTPDAQSTTDSGALVSVVPLSWQKLLPIADREVLNHYKEAQNTSITINESTDWANDISDKIFNSISAAADKGFQNAMVSAETVSDFNGKLIELPGFIVPIEFYENNSPSLIFIVPYYGACIHFPPPPPNQMVFARLAPSSFQVELEKPYLITGRFNEGLFEDMVGTSAYQIEAISIQAYEGEPDDARQHPR